MLRTASTVPSAGATSKRLVESVELPEPTRRWFQLAKLDSRAFARDCTRRLPAARSRHQRRLHLLPHSLLADHRILGPSRLDSSSDPAPVHPEVHACQCQGKGDAVQTTRRRIRAPTGWSEIGGAGLTEVEPAKRTTHRVAAIRSRAVLAGDPRCVAIRTLHGVAQVSARTCRFRAFDVGRNATAALAPFFAPNRPYGLQWAAHGRNRRRPRGNAGIGTRCGRTRTSNSR